MEPFIFKDAESRLSTESNLEEIQINNLSVNDFDIKNLFFFKILKNQRMIFLICCSLLILTFIFYDVFYYFHELKPRVLKRSAIHCLPLRVSPILKKPEKQIFKGRSFYELKWIAILKINGHSVTWWKDQSGQVEEVKVLDFLGRENIQIIKIHSDAHFIELQNGVRQFRLDFNKGGDHASSGV